MRSPINEDDGLGYARFDRELVMAHGDLAYTLLVVPQIGTISTQVSGSSEPLIALGSSIVDQIVLQIGLSH